MPAGPDETDNHPVGAGTEHVAKDGSSKSKSNVSDHPLHQNEDTKGDKVEFRYHDSKGPAVPKDFDVKEEGTKEERRAKTEALNK